METDTKPLEKVDYTCTECDMTVLFFPGFVMDHLGRAHHGFVWPKQD